MSYLKVVTNVVGFLENILFFLITMFIKSKDRMPFIYLTVFCTFYCHPGAINCQLYSFNGKGKLH